MTERSAVQGKVAEGELDSAEEPAAGEALAAVAVQAEAEAPVEARVSRSRRFSRTST